MRRLAIFSLMLLPAVPLYALANDCDADLQQVDFYRDDLSALKDSLRAMLAAIGKAPGPYATENEDWSLPAYACSDEYGFIPVSVSYRGTLSTAAQQQQIEANFQKQMMDAQARGDYEALARMSQDMQAKAVAMAQTSQQYGPIEIDISANGSAAQVIDPDSVLRDGVGFIALKEPQGGMSSGDERITFYFDKVALKDAQRAARFDLGGAQRVPGQRDLINVQLTLSGPTPIVEAMASGLDAAAVLQQLAEQRTRVSD